MIRRSSLICLEIVAALVAAALLAVGAAWWRLSQGPVELGFIQQHVQAELSEARGGRPVDIERVELAWSKEANALELLAVGITVEDEQGRVLSRSDEARIELGVLPLLIGRVSVVSANFTGGDISIVRKPDGAVHIAFGPVDTPPDIIIPPPPINETLEQRVNRMLDGLEAAFRPVGPGGRLRAVGLRNARLAIVDEAAGGRWTADAAAMNLARDGNALVFAAAALLEGAEGQAPATLRITTDTGLQSAIVEFGAENVRPRALLSQAALGPFAGLDTPLTATISMGLDRQSGINRLEGEVSLGQGVADMAGGQFSLDGGRIRGRYDLATDELILDQLNIAGDRTRIEGEVRVRDASRILKAAPDEPAAFDIVLPSLRLDIPGVLSAPMDLSNVRVAGALNTNARSIGFTRLQAVAGEATLNGTGRVYWAEAGAGANRRTRTGLELEASFSGPLTVQQVLHMWPIKLGEGARSYLAESLTGGRVTDLRATLDVRPADTVGEGLRNEAIDVRFSLADASMRYVPTMSPVTNARGTARLQGNRFDLAVEEARMNNLVLTRGRVEAPQFHPKGALLTIAAHAEGEARNVLEVLNEEPLLLGDKLPVNTATAVGQASIDVRLQRPMLSEVPFEQWRFNIDGVIQNFAAQMRDRRVALTQGRLEVHGDQRAINVTGPIHAGASEVNIAWTETINGGPRAPSSRYEISGSFDATDLVRLGYGVASHAQGRIGVTVRGEGNGFDVSQGDIQLDLRNAAVESPWAFWTKRAGLPASARFDLVRQTDGTLILDNLDARGAGLNAQGRIHVRGEDILDANFTRLAVEGRSDARLRATRASDGGLDVEVRGALFDAQPFMDTTQPEGAEAQRAAAAEPPMRASIIVDRLKMRGGATLAQANVSMNAARGGLVTLIASGRAPSGGAMDLALGPRPDDPSGRIRFTSADAGFAMRALTGTENIVGGTASAEGDWRGGPPAQANFTVRLRDFRVVRMPAMAGLLSSVGSLTGMVDTLNGDGIGFSALDAPIAMNGNRMRITEARAAGPALGLTASGAYEMARDDLDIDGVVVPSYGLNSVLGNLPIVGDLLVSRQGEGVFGMTYSLNGEAANPRVGVNPVSMVTPGILRRIFEPVQPRGEREEAPREASSRVAEGGTR